MRRKPYSQYPLYRFHVTNKYYILLHTKFWGQVNCKAEILQVEDKSKMSDAFLGAGLKTVHSIYAESSFKAVRDAKAWIREQVRPKQAGGSDG